MFLKKFILAVTLFCGLMIVVRNSSGVENTEIIELRYRYRIESRNSLWHLFFFLFTSAHRQFLWQEKEGHDLKGYYHEVLFFTGSRLVARFFSQNNKFEAKVDFGRKEERGELNSNQTRTWFEMQHFCRSAKPGDVYLGDYQTAKNNYKILIKAKEIILLKTSSDKFLNVLYFEGLVLRKEKQFLEIKFWMSKDKEFRGQIVKCHIKKIFWPTITIEID